MNSASRLVSWFSGRQWVAEPGIRGEGGESGTDRPWLWRWGWGSGLGACSGDQCCARGWSQSGSWAPPRGLVRVPLPGAAAESHVCQVSSWGCRLSVRLKYHYPVSEKHTGGF